MLDVKRIRPDFPILERKENGARLVYLDNAATSQKPRTVLEAIQHYYSFHNANVHRGAYALAVEATDAYEAARTAVARFLNAWARETVGLAAATADLEQLGLDRVAEHEQELARIAIERLSHIEGVTVYGPRDHRAGVVPFTYGDIHPHDLATILDRDGVCIRAGHHCTQPLMRRLGVAATARASFYIYNDVDDVDALVTALRKAGELFGVLAS